MAETARPAPKEPAQNATRRLVRCWRQRHETAVPRLTGQAGGTQRAEPVGIPPGGQGPSARAAGRGLSPGSWPRSRRIIAYSHGNRIDMFWTSQNGSESTAYFRPGCLVNLPNPVGARDGRTLISPWPLAPVQRGRRSAEGGSRKGDAFGDQAHGNGDDRVLADWAFV